MKIDSMPVFSAGGKAIEMINQAALCKIENQFIALYLELSVGFTTGKKQIFGSSAKDMEKVMSDVLMGMEKKAPFDAKKITKILKSDIPDLAENMWNEVERQARKYSEALEKPIDYGNLEAYKRGNSVLLLAEFARNSELEIVPDKVKSLAENTGCPNLVKYLSDEYIKAKAPKINQEVPKVTKVSEPEMVSKVKDQEPQQLGKRDTQTKKAAVDNLLRKRLGLDTKEQNYFDQRGSKKEKQSADIPNTYYLHSDIRKKFAEDVTKIDDPKQFIGAYIEFSSQLISKVKSDEYRGKKNSQEMQESVSKILTDQVLPYMQVAAVNMDKKQRKEIVGILKDDMKSYVDTLDAEITQDTYDLLKKKGKLKQGEANITDVSLALDESYKKTKTYQFGIALKENKESIDTSWKKIGDFCKKFSDRLAEYCYKKNEESKQKSFDASLKNISQRLDKDKLISKNNNTTKSTPINLKKNEVVEREI